jgi:hypothetical protein
VTNRTLRPRTLRRIGGDRDHHVVLLITGAAESALRAVVLADTKMVIAPNEIMEFGKELKQTDSIRILPGHALHLYNFHDTDCYISTVHIRV